MKHYPPEFKAEAVALYRSRPGATIAAVAADLGVNTETLQNWLRSDDRHRAGPTEATATPAAAPASGTLESENAALRKRIRRWEEEREILRKAAKYFAGQTRW